MISTRHTLAVTAAALAISFVGGCSSDNGAGSTTPGVPEGLEVDAMSEAPIGTWIERGESFAVVTMGSSSCPPVATDVRAEKDDQVVVTFGSSPNDPCSADMAPTTHQFDLPEGIATGNRVSVDIVFEDWPETHTFILD